MSEKNVEEIVNGSYMITQFETRLTGLLLNEGEEPYVVYVGFHTIGQLYVASVFVNREYGEIINPLVSSLYAIVNDEHGDAYKRIITKMVSSPDMPPSILSFGAKDVVVEIIAVKFGSEESMPIMSKVVYPLFMDTKYAVKTTNDIIGDDPAVILSMMSSSYSDEEEKEEGKSDEDVGTASKWDNGIYV